MHALMGPQSADNVVTAQPQLRTTINNQHGNTMSHEFLRHQLQIT